MEESMPLSSSVGMPSDDTGKRREDPLDFK
jgi:hypothetical protein